MPSSFEIDVDELNTLAVTFATHSLTAIRRGERLVDATAQRVVATAQRLVPVDTGTTKSSIHATRTSFGSQGAIEAEIGPTTEYAPHLEYGTVNMAPHAFMGPAIDRETPDFVTLAAQIADGL